MSEQRLTFEGGRYQERLHSVLAKTAFLLGSTGNIEPEGVACGFFATTQRSNEKLHRKVTLSMYVCGVAGNKPHPGIAEQHELSYPFYDYYISTTANAKYDLGIFPRIVSGAIISVADGYTSGFLARADLTNTTIEEYERVPKVTLTNSREVDVIDDSYALSELSKQTPSEVSGVEYLSIAEHALNAVIDEYTFGHIL